MAVPYRLRAPRPTFIPTTGESLGPVVRSYRMAAQRNVIWAAAPFALLLAYVVWLGHEGLLLRWFNSMFSVAAVSSLFVLSIVLIVYTATIGGAEAVRVHANGIFDMRGQARAVRWDEMRSLVAVCSDAGSVVRHLLRTEDGSVLSLGRSIGDVDALVDEVRVRMSEHKTEALEARLASGGTVRFGVVEARSDGLHVNGKLLPWREVGAIESEGDEILLYDRAGQPWARAALGEVPNAFLLVEVAERLAVKAVV
jgi:hypothetical protein